MLIPVVTVEESISAHMIALFYNTLETLFAFVDWALQRLLHNRLPLLLLFGLLLLHEMVAFLDHLLDALLWFKEGCVRENLQFLLGCGRLQEGLEVLQILQTLLWHLEEHRWDLSCAAPSSSEFLPGDLLFL